MSITLTDPSAVAALKARLGKGARYDAANAPAEDLLLARRGTAFFARKLMELSDAALYQPSAAAGLSRAHVVAGVCYAARYQALSLEALCQGERYLPPTEEDEKLPDTELAATLPARALRHLFQHSAVHLNVCWRDLTNQQWDTPVILHDGTEAEARALPMMRARQLWYGALELGNGARRADLPAALRGD
jgi:maleylpyruvate isomerase